MSRQAVICEGCGHAGRPKTDTPGSFAIELVLWVAFCVPGLIYSLWRMSARRQVCAACSGAVLVPVDSPRGRLLAAHYGRPR